MPSPQPPRSPLERVGRVGIVLILSAVFSILLVALEEGYLDETLTARAEHELSAALGPDFDPAVGSVRLRFTQTWLLGLAAGGYMIVRGLYGVITGEDAP